MAHDGGVTMLDLHRELCAAVRGADQAFARLYVAAPDSEAASHCETQYVLALVHVNAALRALESVCVAGAVVGDAACHAVADSARRVC